MSKKDTSGPAFPTSLKNYKTVGAGSGMTLRDFFAAHALQGLLVGEHDPDYVLLADMAYQLANQMMIARDTV